MHMISKKDLNSDEMDTLTKSCSPTIVITANVEVQTHEEATLYIKELDTFLTMKVLENTPAVLSLGKLCDEHEYSYEWINGQKPHLIKKGFLIQCNTENFVPIVVPGFSTSSSSSSHPSTSMTPSRQEIDHPTSSSSSSTSTTMTSSTMSSDNGTGAWGDLCGIDSYPVTVSSKHVERKERGDLLTKPTKNPKPNKNEDHDLERRDLLNSDTNGSGHVRAKQKLHRKLKEACKKFLEPDRKPKVIYTDNFLEFGKACEELSWNHCTSTPHRSETNEIAKRAARRIMEGISAVLLQSGLGHEWWADSMECYCYLRNIQDLLSDGKTPCERRFGMPFNGPVIPFEAMVEYHLSLRKTYRDYIKMVQKSCQVYSSVMHCMPGQSGKETL